MDSTDPNMKESLAKSPKHQPSFTEMATQRIAVLKDAISILNSRTGGTPKKLAGLVKRQEKHLAEMAELKEKLEGASQDELSGNTIGESMTSRSSNASPRPVSREETPYSASPAEDWQIRMTPEQAPRYQLRSKRQGITPERAPSQQQTADPQIPRNSDLESGWTRPVRDAIVPPSKASGGVPEASEAYIQRASLPPVLALQPQHVLLVIDLNGTILYRPDRKRPSHFVMRQSTQLFLDYVFFRFQVMIWSSARPENVRLMCNQLFPGPARQRLLAEWGRDRMSLSPDDYKRRVQVYKRFEKIWEDPDIQRRHPLSSSGAFWDQSNTVLIDDSIEKGRSQPFNLVEVPEFRGKAESDVLRQLADYLDDLLMQADVSAYIRQKPFQSATATTIP